MPLVLLPHLPARAARTARTAVRAVRPVAGARANAGDARRQDLSRARERTAAAVRQATARSPRTWVPVQRPAAPSAAVGSHGVDVPASEAELQVRLCDYVLDGLSAGDTCVVVATPERVRALHQRLALAGVHPDGERLVVRDVERALAAQLGPSGPSAERFDRVAGGDLRRLLARGRPVRVYGETCDVLLARGERTAAAALERCWDELLRTLPVTVLCAYSAGRDGLAALVGPTHSHAVPA